MIWKWVSMSLGPFSTLNMEPGLLFKNNMERGQYVVGSILGPHITLDHFVGVWGISIRAPAQFISITFDTMSRMLCSNQ
ncbi:hypothetical protein CI610_03565 [invertebrate metagenome]|uniref:Uncharacterized protein n=1 Tax=invertebrate metagenome TaxID=1711999 RepID=A0A2H9T2Q0_9ZZZZ